MWWKYSTGFTVKMHNWIDLLVTVVTAHIINIYKTTKIWAAFKAQSLTCLELWIIIIHLYYTFLCPSYEWKISHHYLLGLMLFQNCKEAECYDRKHNGDHWLPLYRPKIDK